MNEKAKIKWYDKSWFMWVLFLIMPYLGVPFMWLRKKEYSSKKKIVLSIVFGLYAILIISSAMTDTEPTINGNEGNTPTISSSSNSEENKNEEKAENNEPVVEKIIDLENINTVEDINTAYTENMTDIMDKKPLKDLSEVTSKMVNERAVFSAELIINDVNNLTATEKIDAVEKLVTLDDFAYHIDEEVIKSTSIDIITMWENDVFLSADDKKLFEVLYITRLLDRSLQSYPDYSDVLNVNFDIYQITKDALRGDDSSKQANIEQIEKNLDNAKSQLGIETPESIRKDWIDAQFSAWDGSHTAFEDLIKDNLNDEKSYDHIETTYLDINNQDMLDMVNGILADAGYSNKVEIDDLLITTEFSAKNGFGGTIKNTAIGIASYSTNSITLVAVE